MTLSATLPYTVPKESCPRWTIWGKAASENSALREVGDSDNGPSCRSIGVTFLRADSEFIIYVKLSQCFQLRKSSVLTFGTPPTALV